MAGPSVGGSYSASVDYPAGAVVVNSASTYVSLQTNGPSTTVKAPGTDNTFWVATTGAAPSGSAGGQVVITDGSTFAPQAPMTITGDVSLSANGVTSIGAAVVTGSEIAPHTIANGNIGLAAITSSNIATGTIIGPNIAYRTITGANIASGTITGVNLAPYAISGINIANRSISIYSLATTGTAVAGTYLDGTGAWSTPASSNPLTNVTNWSSSANYTVGQIVFCQFSCATNGSTYVATSSSIGSDPSLDWQATYWQTIAQGGAQGDPGPSHVYYRVDGHSTALYLQSVDNNGGISDAAVGTSQTIVGVSETSSGGGYQVFVDVYGGVECQFDAPIVDSGTYVVLSPTVAGQCHDAGYTMPTSGRS